MSDSITDLIERHQAEIASWGHLPAAMRFKQAIVERVGINEAFRLGRQVLKVPGLDTLRIRQIKGLRQAAEESAEVFRELWGGGEAFVQAAPTVLGKGNHAPIYGNNRSAYIACLRDVAVRGRSALILRDCEALIDFERDEFSVLEDNLEYDPGILHATRDTLWTMEAQYPSMIIDEAFMLSGSHSIDFGHWITEYLPKYIIATLAGLPPGTPVLIDEVMPATHRQALELLIPPKTEIITIPHLAPVSVGRLWCAPNAMYMGFYPTTFSLKLWAHLAMDPKRSAAIMREIVDRTRSAISSPTGRQRLFLARKPHLKKKLINHEAIEGIAASRGFEIVYPETLCFVDQMRLAQHANYIVAPEGSNTFLSFFARPGTRVCTLNPPYTYPLVDSGATFTELGLDYTILTGPDAPTDEFCPFWYDYQIDKTQFADFLDHWAGPNPVLQAGF